MKRLVLACLALLLAAVAASLGEAAQGPPTPVVVTNFPANQNVTDSWASTAVFLRAECPTSAQLCEAPFTDLSGTPYMIPSGKRLVIDSISGFVALPPGVPVRRVTIGTSYLETVQRVMDVFAVSYGGSPTQYLTISVPQTRFFVDHGANTSGDLFAAVMNDDASTSAHMWFHLSVVGHLVTAP